ncbi:MAG: 16S rRNA (guanine(527)-N(7))-methyltransferase RsmG [Desulfovibrionaceae bacterium]|nr:16S rRNA (guanine(527)-N(7))-methyltransferase RsmG [Desulfovibrionaceae bacterium]
MSLTTRSLKELFVRSGHPIPDSALNPLLSYLALLMKWNQVIGLTAEKTMADIVEKHAIDSIVLAETFNDNLLPCDPLLYDLGSGAGLPAIPLRILWQRGRSILVEKQRKRASFLRYALAALALKETSVFEGFAQDLPEKADCLVSKAFLPIQKLLPLALTLLKDEGLLAVLTSHSVDTDATKELRSWRCVREIAYTARSQARYLWILSPKSVL